MADHDSEFGEFLLHILADDASLDAGNHVALIDPLDFVHPRHVHRHDRPLLLLLAHKGFSNVSASSEGDQDDVMLLCRLDQVLGLLVRGDIDHIINSPRQLAESQQEEFLQRVAVRVEDARHFIGVNLVYLALYLLDEEEVFDWWVDGDFPLRLDGAARVDSDDCLHPVLELGHLLARELVSAAGDLDLPVVAQEELGVLEAPTVVFEPLLFVADRLARLDVLLFKDGVQVLQPNHDAIMVRLSTILEKISVIMASLPSFPSFIYFFCHLSSF